MKGPKYDAVTKYLLDDGFSISKGADRIGSSITKSGIEEKAVRVYFSKPGYSIELESDDEGGDAQRVGSSHDFLKLRCEALLKPDVPPCPPHVPSPEQDYLTVLHGGSTKDVYYRWIDDLPLVGLAFRKPFVIFTGGRWIRTTPIAYDHFGDELWATSTLRDNAVGSVQNFSKLDPNHLRKDL